MESLWRQKPSTTQKYPNPSGTPVPLSMYLQEESARIFYF